MSSKKRKKSAPTLTVKIRPKAVLKRVQVGERIQSGDWCCDVRSSEPVQTGGGVFLTEHHHPHYRIEFEQ